MKYNKNLTPLMWKKLAKIRGYQKMPSGHTLWTLLDLWWEATNEELILVCKDIISFYNEKIDNLEKQIKPIKQIEFKDYIIEKIKERFYEEMNESKRDEVWCEINECIVTVKAQWFWEKSFWFDYEIKFWDEVFTGTYCH